MGHDPWTDRDLTDPQPLGKFHPIAAELTAGERIVWEGKPQLGPIAIKAAPVALVGILVGGFALGWITMAFHITDNSPFPFARVFPLFGLPFLVIGAGMILMPAWAAWRGSRTRYAITDRRAIVCEPQLVAGIQTRSYAAGALGKIVRNQRNDGSGDLIFEEIQTIGSKGRLHITQRGFFAITEVRHVEEILRATLLADRLQS